MVKSTDCDNAPQNSGENANLFLDNGGNKANPLATILSVAMMLRHSFDQGAAADRIEKAVEDVLNEGYRTADIQEPGCKLVGCKQMGQLVRDKIQG